MSYVDDGTGEASEEIEMVYHFETEWAWRMSPTGDVKDAVWLPKSKVTMEPTKAPNVFVVTVPEWLAKDRGLI